MTERRTTTAPEVKWLVNEMAALSGELERVDRELTRLRGRRKHLQRALAALREVSGVLACPLQGVELPVVHAHGSWGGRGSLRNYFRGALRAAHPLALDTLALGEGAVVHFKATFASPEEERFFRRKKVSHVLRKLVERGEVERLHDPVAAPGSVGVWRWKVNQPSIAELLALDPPDADASEGGTSWP